MNHQSEIAVIYLISLTIFNKIKRLLTRVSP